MAALELVLLRSFVTVVEAGGFTSSERRLHLTQSTISQHIKRLESAVGAPLLVRAKSGVVPTEAGERVLSYARRMLALAGELEHAVSLGSRTATVRVGMTDDFAQLHLPSLLERVRERLPRLSLTVTCDLSIHLRKALARGEFDLVLYKRLGPRGEARPLLEESLVWVAADDFTLDRRAPLPLVLFPRGCVYRKRAVARLEASERAWTAAFESPSMVSVEAALRAGLGVAVLSTSAIPKGCRAVAGLPALGKCELVYEFGGSPGEETRALLRVAASLLGTSAVRARTTRGVRSTALRAPASARRSQA
jgi:DNA-binding transcriptional LysR family regulator